MFDILHRIITCSDIDDKCRSTTALLTQHRDGKLGTASSVAPEDIAIPGLPEHLQLVAPRCLKRRGIQNQVGRNVLMHAIAHIEFNAINLALDAAYRFRDQPKQYTLDWIGVAADEARHFGLVRGYLVQHDCDYGEYPAHNGLWEMALKTSHDVLARMALVPRVMEARGLDVTPKMIRRLQAVGDDQAADILGVIYTDEIEHVRIGSSWFNWLCLNRGLDPGPTCVKLVENHLHGDLKGPFNHEARLRAGFGEQELRNIEALQG